MNIDTQVKEILKANGLDFQLEKTTLQSVSQDGNTYLTPYYGLMNRRSKQTINTVKAGYTISQNDEIVRVVLEGIQKFGAKVNVKKAGSIGDGRKIFIQLEVTGKAKVGQDDITQYLTILNSNDGSAGFSVGIGDEVAHCTNQFFKFYKGSNAKFRHTTTITEKIKRVPHLIELALSKSLEQVKIYESFLSTPLTKRLANKMVNEVLGYDRQYTSPMELAKLTQRSEKMMDLLYHDIEEETKLVGENVWGLFNGLTRFTTHEQKEYKKENGRMESMLLGRNYKKAMDGYNFLVKDLKLV